MTKITAIVAMTLASLLGHAQVSETRNTAGFSKIELESGIELIYTQSPEVSLKVEADTRKDLSNIVTELNGKKLRVYYSSTDKTAIAGKMKVYVNANNVNSFKVTSKSKLFFVNAVIADKISIAVFGGASFTGTVAKNSKVVVRAGSGALFSCMLDTDNLDAYFESGAAASLTGSAKELNLRTMTGAFCNAKNLVSESARVTAKKVSAALIQGKGTINANAETGSSITYFGEPRKIILAPNSFAIARKKILSRDCTRE